MISKTPLTHDGYETRILSLTTAAPGWWLLRHGWSHAAPIAAWALKQYTTRDSDGEALDDWEAVVPIIQDDISSMSDPGEGEWDVSYSPAGPPGDWQLPLEWAAEPDPMADQS